MLTPKEIFKKLNPCGWQYNGKNGSGDKYSYGFIAQDLLRDFGEKYDFVRKDGEYYSVDYGKFVGVMVQVIKEQEERIEQLENQLKELK